MRKLTDHQLELVKVGLHNKVAQLAARVAPVYALLDWQWADEGVPTQEDIEISLLDLVDSLQADAEGCLAGTGGLYAKYDIDEEGGIDAYVGMDISELAWLTFTAHEAD